MTNDFLIHIVKTASVEHKDHPEFDRMCREHADTLEMFLAEVLDRKME